MAKTKTKIVYRTVKKVARKRRVQTGIFSGAGLTKGQLPRGMGMVTQILNIISAMVLGALAGQGTVAMLNRFVPPPIPQIAGGLVSFTTGGIAGVGGYALTSGLIGSPEAQASMGA
tara:strand:- start:1081 stop:1428 length:348 start_codon:yes stop_codon:yes gene_type:complete